ncbi:hypothetical protein BV25DRAFT_1829831 [Artomyces pyxidatus]|uniref:Uncharacterized protein n=1 Tax=Artomyces pyxidatus TaxID=48021 RepID=A0ACB8SR83_9AGAM|nr:hypothetical protein BV25DRAFT_1829831 [Artomyces pyxidatus]
MSQSTYPRARAPSPFFRHRPLGRAPSPPTWACYEQIHSSDYDLSASDDSDEDEEDEEDEDDAVSCSSEHVPEDDDGCSEDGDDYPAEAREHGHDSAVVDGMDLDEAGDAEKRAQVQKDKGKQRAVEPAAVSEKQRRGRRQRQHRQHTVTLRPILTIQRSQGFVWNQDLFVPPYIKDRYVASTSPPNSSGFISTSASSTHSALSEYEIEVVEIRVREGELASIIP